MVECTLSITHCLRLNLQLHTIDLVRTCRIKAKFHYTDPTRTGPDTDKVRAHCRRRAKFHHTDTDTDPTGPGSPTKSVHVVGYELNSTTRTRHGPDTDPTGPARTRTDFFCGETPLGPVGSV